MAIQHILLTDANRRMEQIREFAHREGLVVLTSHDKPAAVVLDVNRCQRLLTGIEQLTQLLLANKLVEAAWAISAVDALEVNDCAVQVLGHETLRLIAWELVETVRNNVSID
jgi:PHD/YefM family antitoxin component YafN of YafNO toxin-antitoxin module